MNSIRGYSFFPSSVQGEQAAVEPASSGMGVQVTQSRFLIQKLQRADSLLGRVITMLRKVACGCLDFCQAEMSLAKERGVLGSCYKENWGNRTMG